jgi:phage shock protein E
MHRRIAVIVAIVFASYCNAAVAIEHTKDTLGDVRKNIDANKAVLIDVREQDEWDEGHLKEAVLVTLSKLTEAAKSGKAADAFSKTLPKKKIIYCHCRSGYRTLKAGAILKQWGFDVRPLKAGYDDLIEAGFEKSN